MSAGRPLFHQEQTFVGTHRTAVSCQLLPYAGEAREPGRQPVHARLRTGGKAIRKISLMIDSAAPYVLHRRSKLRTKSIQTLPWQSNGRKTTEEGSDEQEFR